MHLIKLIVLCLGVLLAIPSTYASSCSATNDNNDASCSVDCSEGQVAACQNATGSGTPTCQCNSSATFGKFKVPPGNINIKAANAIETTDAVDVFNRKLQSSRDVNLSSMCHRVETGEQICRTRNIPCLVGPKGVEEIAMISGCRTDTCFPKTREECSPVKGKLRVVGPVIVQRDPIVSVKEPNWDSIPFQAIGRQVSYLNCSPNEQTQTYSIQQEVVTGGRVQVQRTVTNASKFGVKVSYTYGLPATGAGTGELTASFENTISVQNLDEQSFQQKQTISESYPVSLPKNSVTTFTVKWRRVEAPIPFTGSVIADAAVTENLESIKLASQLLPDEKDRTLQFSGVIYNATVTSAEVINLSRPATVEDCKGNEGRYKFLSADNVK